MRNVQILHFRDLLWHRTFREGQDPPLRTVVVVHPQGIKIVNDCRRRS